MALNSKGLGEYNGSISYFNRALAINRNLIIFFNNDDIS